MVNLAAADMMVATFFAPYHIFIHTFTHPDGVTGRVLCSLVTGGGFAWVGGACSTFTLVAIAIERYYAVNYPHGNKGKLTNAKLKVRYSTFTHLWVGWVSEIHDHLTRFFETLTQ